MTNLSLQKIIRFLVLFSPLFYPAYLFRFRVAGIPFTVLEIFVYLLFGLWLITVAMDRKSFVWNSNLPLYWLPAFLLILGASIGVVAAPHEFLLPDGTVFAAKQTALGVFKGWIVAPALYFFVLTQVLKSADDVQKIFRTYIYSAVLVSLVALGFGLFTSTGITPDFRLRGFYESANYLALYIIPALLIATTLAVSSQRSALQPTNYNLQPIRLPLIISFIILLFTLLFTQSYAGILAVFGAVLIYGFWMAVKNPNHRKKVFGAGLALIFILMGLIASQWNSPKFRQFLDFKNRSSTSVRLELYRVSLNLIQTHPLIGVGSGLFQPNYQIAARRVLGQDPMEWNLPSPHNLFLGFWLNAGILGLIAFLTFLVLAHRRFTYPLIALWGIVFHGLFDMPFWKNDLAMVFWLVMAAIVVMQKRFDSKDII